MIIRHDIVRAAYAELSPENLPTRCDNQLYLQLAPQGYTYLAQQITLSGIDRAGALQAVSSSHTTPELLAQELDEQVTEPCGRLELTVPAATLLQGVLAHQGKWFRRHRASTEIRDVRTRLSSALHAPDALVAASLQLIVEHCCSHERFDALMAQWRADKQLGAHHCTGAAFVVGTYATQLAIVHKY